MEQLKRYFNIKQIKRIVTLDANDSMDDREERKNSVS